MTMTARGARAQGKARLRGPEVARNVGERVRAMRKTQKVTLAELAKRTGIDVATISRIETGKMTGTLESHLKLVNALGGKLTELYAGIEESQAKRLASLQGPAHRSEVYVHQAGKASLTMLTADVLQKKLMPVLIAIEPGGATQKEEARVGTEKFLYVLDGSLDVHLAEDLHHLSRGSTLYFDASIPHIIRNPGSKPARCLAMTTPPAL